MSQPRFVIRIEEGTQEATEFSGESTTENHSTILVVEPLFAVEPSTKCRQVPRN